MADGDGAKPFPACCNSDGRGFFQRQHSTARPTPNSSKVYCMSDYTSGLAQHGCGHCNCILAGLELLRCGGPQPKSRLSSCPQRRWAEQGQRPRCISCLTLRFDSGTTKHRRNVKSSDPNHNLIVKRADSVIVMLRFLFTEPIPCRS